MGMSCLIVAEIGVLFGFMVGRDVPQGNLDMVVAESIVLPMMVWVFSGFWRIVRHWLDSGDE